VSITKARLHQPPLHYKEWSSIKRKKKRRSDWNESGTESGMRNKQYTARTRMSGGLQTGECRAIKHGEDT
jgi:hypothetical protein